jgi:glycosidase
LCAGLLGGALCGSAAHAVVIESDGTVFIEAEDFSANIPRSNHTWVVTNNLAGFSGTAFAHALPDDGTDAGPNITNSTELAFDIQFTTAAVHRLWTRVYATNGTSDSIHYGLNGQTGVSDRISWTTYSNWFWAHTNPAGVAAAFSVASTGTHTVNVWMREDGARVDRIAVITDPNFEPRIGNSWHIPGNVEPGIPSMRLPFATIFSNTAVTIFNGNQFQGGTNGANQLQVGSSIFYRNATNAAWIELPLLFHSQSGNNKYFSNTIPANVFSAGDVVQYYLRIAYSDRLPTYLYVSNDVARETELESVARANPFGYHVLDQPASGYPSPADWRDMNFYMLFTDRFNDGDPLNNNLHPEEPARPTNALGIHGGDFKGLENKLDYIKALGASAIWITPVYLTAGTNTAYHGYTAQDFYQISPTWGGMPALTSMIAAAHSRDLRVILDIVCQHQGNRIDSADPAWTNAFKLAGYAPRWTVATNVYPPPFNQLTNFHNHGHISNYNSQTETELGELRGLDDLRTETEYVRTNMLNIYRDLLVKTDADAFRLDAVKHADMEFWQLFNPDLRAFAAAMGKTNFFQFGESVDSEAKNGSYTGTKSGAAFANDSVLDFTLYFSVNSVFINGGNTKQIEDHYNAIAANYDPAATNRLVTFIDNHDRSRFMSFANANTNKLVVALDFLYTARGIPCLYYGTEQNFNGYTQSGFPPTNREDMFDGEFEPLAPCVGDNFNMTHPTFLHIAKLNNFRRLYPALLRGTHVNLWNDGDSAGLFAYERRMGTQELFIVFNTAGSSQTLPERQTSYPAGTTLVNVFNTNEVISVTATGSTPSVSVPGTTFKMFIAAAQWLPLDPVVTNQVPAHGATNVSPVAPLVLRFSEPMETASVQNAFSVSPPVAGAFAWNGARTEMTFTPAGPGFTALVTNRVRVTNGTDTASGNSLYAPFETFFVTAASPLTDSVPPTVSLTLPVPGSVIGGSFVVSGGAADSVGVQRVEFRLDAGLWTVATGTTSWAYGLDSAHFLNGSHTLAARAWDGSGNVSTEALASVKFFNVPGGYEQRLSAGNPDDATNCDASVWVSDRAYSLGSFGYTNGTTGNVLNVITDLCPQAQTLYQRERKSAASFDYLFDAPEGRYETTLLEAETLATGPTQRQFSIYIEGDQAVADHDIFVAAGGMHRTNILVFTNDVPDAQVSVHFVASVGDARVSGVQVKRVGDVDSDSDGIPNWWTLGHFDHPTGQEGDLSRAEDDTDGDGFNNLDEFIALTNPTSAPSFFMIDALSAGPIASVTLAGASGRVYDLEALLDLPSTSAWTVIQQNVPGTGVPLNLTDTNQSDQQSYRVRVRKP